MRREAERPCVQGVWHDTARRNPERSRETRKNIKGSRAYKPNSVCWNIHCRRPKSATGTTYRRTAIPLGRALLRGSSDLPESCGAPSRHAPGEPGSFPIWSCSVWGLPCPLHYCGGGALLPHLFTLTPSLSVVGHSSQFIVAAALANGQRPMTNSEQPTTHSGGAVCFLWHFPSTILDDGFPDVIRHTALWSSDFPPSHLTRKSDRPAQLPTAGL